MTTARRHGIATWTGAERAPVAALVVLLAGLILSGCTALMTAGGDGQGALIAGGGGEIDSRFAAEEDLRPAGNKRMAAVSLKEALRRVIDATTKASAELVIDDEPFSIRIEDGYVTVSYKPDPDAAVSIAMDYEAIIAVADGDMDFAEFGAKHVRPLRGSKKSVKSFSSLMARAFTV